MASELRTSDLQSVGFGDLEWSEDSRRWSWMLDRRMIMSALSAISGATLLLSVATGMMTFERDPLNALAKRDAGSDAPLDTSWAVEFRIIPDHPIGVELRKMSSEETLRLYTPRD